MEELHGIAKQLGLSVSDSDAQMDLIYRIIDEESMQAASGKTVTEKAAPRKRTRIKKEPDRVYSANQTNGENFDLKKKNQQEALKSLELEAATPVAAPVETPAPAPEAEAEEAAPAPKKRGRKSKAEKAAMEAALQAEQQAEQPAAEPVVEAVAPQEPEAPAAPVEAPVAEAPAKEEVPATDSTDDGFDVKAFFAAKEPDFIVLTELPSETFEAENEESPAALPAQVENREVPSAPAERPAAARKNDNRWEAPANRQDNNAPAELPEERYDFGEIITGQGVLEIMPDGYGFLRSSDYNYLASPDDIYVSVAQIKHFGLKTGDVVEGPIRTPREGEKYFPLIRVTQINGRSIAEVRDRVPFEHLTPLFPDEKFRLCKGYNDSLSARVVTSSPPSERDSVLCSWRSPRRVKRC